MFGYYIVPFILAAGCTAALAPVSIWAGRRLKAVDKPGGRRIHDRPLPRIGGLAIYGGFMLAIAFLPGGFLHEARVGALVAGTMAFLVGFLDDLLGFKPWLKFLGQIVTAAILPAYGISIRFVTNPFGGIIDLRWLAAPATIFWVAALMNMINLIDGLDGLAAGVSGIAALCLLFLPQCTNRPFVAVLCVLAAGCAAGFLPFNFYPARTFMGDGGSHFLGFILGYITVAGTLKGHTALALSVPLLALGVPYFDTVFAIFRRWRNKRPIYAADRGHLHHQLLFLGFNQRQTVLLLYFSSGLFGLGSIFLARAASTLGAVMLVGLLTSAAFGLSRLDSDRLVH